ncbi:transcriptional regulator ATRX-like isoform X2 [Pseudomyrmex gracilis]|uniref:transcriptional regulator ATRX-like isoform X2 n=1 Tax=Pseudomyrmex gracilis TaxID=219809 RepID=UPI0009959095|nr:transcriptional regulator ATRX-like isoform X2 [Pseudomyrmex gracilis]
MSSKRKIKITEQEMNYRKKHFHEIRIAKTRLLVCTSCGNELKVEMDRVFSHSVMGILQCKTCWDYFNEVHNKSEGKYCYICGHNKKLYECGDKNCDSSFCKGCLKRNVNRELLNAADDDWKCCICNPKPFWELRAVCSTVMDSIVKTNRKSKMNKRTLPSQKLRLQKSQEIRKTLAVLCDDDDTDSSGSAFVATRMAQKTNNTSCQIKQKTSSVPPKQLVEVETSSSDCSIISEKLATSHKQSAFKNGRDTKSIKRKEQDSSSSEEETASKSTVRDKIASKQRHAIKSNVRIEKEVKNKINKRSCTESSDSESEENNSTNKISNARKGLPKNTVYQDKKREIKSSNKKTKARAKKHLESTSESEDEDVEYKRKQSTGKSRVRVQNDEESDDSSGKEFQKEKLQKVHRSKFSLKNSTDLEVDYTKTPVLGNNTNNINEESCQNLDDAKQIIIECKKMCSNFKMHIEALELQYKNKDDERLILKTVEKMSKLKQIIDRKYTDLTTIYQSWKNPSAKKPQKKSTRENLTESEESSEKSNEERVAVENKPSIAMNEQEENTNVSECDSDQIFSADESRSLQKKRVVENEMNTPSRAEDNPNGVDAETDSEDISLTYKDRDDETHADSRDASITTSTALDTSKKINTQSVEQSENVENQNNKDCSADANTESDDKRTTPVAETSNSEVECSPLRSGVKSITLQNGKQVFANEEHVLNTSADIFETSCEVVEDAEEVENKTTETPERNDAETDRNKEISSSETCNKKSSSEIKSSNKEAALLNEIPSEETKTSSSCYTEKNEKDVSDKNTQLVNKKTDNNSKNTDASSRKKVNNDEFPDDSEALAKKNLLESDSDSLENASSNTEINTAPEDMIKDFIDQIRKEKETKHKNSDDDDSDTSTIILSPTKKRMSAAKEADTEVTSQAERDNSPINKSNESISLDEDAIKEQAAKKELLKASTDESETAESSCDSQEVIQKSELSSSAENIKAKKALLASNSENSSVELASETETRVSKNLKRTHEPDSDAESTNVRTNKKRLKFEKHRYYKNNDDEKLRMSCEVRLVRLSERVLKRHSRALQKSREYLEQKALKSLTNLAKLEKKRKNKTGVDSNTSTDEDGDALSTAKSSNKQQTEKQTSKEESLMDYLKQIENGEVSITAETDSISDELIQVNGIVDQPVSNEALLSEANRIAKENLLNSPDSYSEKEVESDNDNKSNDDEDGKTGDKQTKRLKKSEEDTSKEDSDKKEKSSWRRDKLLTMRFSDSDSEAEKEKWKKKQEKTAESLDKDNNSENEETRRKMKKKKNKRRRILDSDSDVILTDCSSDSDSDTSEQNDKKDKDKQRKHKRGSVSLDSDSSLEEKKPKVKRKRIKKMASDSDSSDSSVEELKNSQGSTPGKSGRKNIRKVLKDKQVAEDTKLAAKEEEERLKRIAERQSLYNNMYEMRLAGEEKVDKLVLDFNTETKEELVTVHEELVKRLKPHQAEGIKFMWDACFESLERTKTTSGSGCIIAHCMGLGKTLQIIALTHTLLTHEETGIKTVLVVCPLSTVLNWRQEYETWLKDLNEDVDVYELTRFKKNFERKCQLQHWQRTGGVMIIGYEMFRNLSTASRVRKNMKEAIQQCLIDPGADLIVCDEGHLLKNEDTALSKSMRKVRTRRRIVLTGTPLQNNLIEYHCMVQFVKPNLLGTKKEFMNRFVNPITNGQFDNSTEYDVKLMKKRAHVLHKMLEGSVQRFDYSVLTPFLPPKQEYVIFVRLTDPQINMYRFYLDNFARKNKNSGAGGTLFADFQALQRIWTHPIVLRLNAEKVEKKRMRESENDSEGSLKDFINDDTTDVDSSSDSSSDSEVQALDDVKKNVKRRTRNNPDEEPEEEVKEEPEEERAEWWTTFVEPEHFEDLKVSSKLLLLFGILKECEQIGDKVLVFSQSLYSLTLIEEFLRRIDDQTQNNTSLDTLDNHTGSWSLGLDYFRLDGQTSAENRSRWCKIFNRPTNTRARLFLISTRAGGLGINLTAANRVIIFDASWNPSHDVQSIFRIYRFGQKKPCYVYRFLAAGTMEEKIYNRQVTKLSLSCRVVDEQQIERHYSNQNLNELYMFEAYQDNKDKPTLNLPKDRLLAEIFLKYKDVVENYHEHDSLLENKAEEELDEEERKQAWLEYEEEKKGKPPPMMNAQANNLLMQYNAMMSAGQAGMLLQNRQSNSELEDIFKIIRNDYPNLTPHQQRLMASQVLIDMYNYWEKQAALSVRNPQGNLQNLQNVQQPINMPNMAGNSNMRSNMQNHAQTGAVHGNLVPNPFTYRNVPSANNTNKPDDLIEVRPTTSNANTLNAQTAVQLQNNTNKNQEE